MIQFNRFIIIFSRNFSTHKPQGPWEDFRITAEKFNQNTNDVKEGFQKQAIRDMLHHKVSKASFKDDKVIIGNNTTKKEMTKVFIDDQGHNISVKNKLLGFNTKGIMENQHTATEVIMSKERFASMEPKKEARTLR
eukprot:TRINITY_DN9254_c0_g1_i1.p2 TRINITY_DN9254_c0_g1~~TRINITY_DN9254_c0_g1_i1.p2  ORF type:complete len:136 (+),score=0.43 TRINITY_DN9254_c0_g1_i1:1062-1469(+)